MPQVASELPSAPSDLSAYVSNQAKATGLNPAILECLAAHESQWDPTKVGDRKNIHGPSYGLFQINISQHSDVTEAEALDPLFATQWTIKQILAGNIGWWMTWQQYCAAIPIK